MLIYWIHISIYIYICIIVVVISIVIRQLREALEQLKYAEAVLARRGEEATSLMAVTCNNLGCYYKRVGKLHAALSYLRKALRIEVLGA